MWELLDCGVRTYLGRMDCLTSLKLYHTDQQSSTRSLLRVQQRRQYLNSSTCNEMMTIRVLINNGGSTSRSWEGSRRSIAAKTDSKAKHVQRCVTPLTVTVAGMCLSSRAGVIPTAGNNANSFVGSNVIGAAQPSGNCFQPIQPFMSSTGSAPW